MRFELCEKENNLKKNNNKNKRLGEKNHRKHKAKTTKNIQKEKKK